MLLGQIGDGNDGMIQAITISPDGKYLVSLVWVYPRSHEPWERESEVRVFELVTGNLQACFRYLGTMQDLDFSADGKYLAMVGNPNEPIRCGYLYAYASEKILQGFGKLPRPSKSHMAVLYDNNTLIPSYVRFVPEDKGTSSDYRIVAAPWTYNNYAGPEYAGDAEYTGKLLWYSYSAKGLKKINEIKQRNPFIRICWRSAASLLLLQPTGTNSTAITTTVNWSQIFFGRPSRHSPPSQKTEAS